MNAEEDFREIFEDSDSDDSDFDGAVVNDNIDSDGDVYMTNDGDTVSDSETAEQVPDDRDQAPAAGDRQRAPRVQGGGDAYRVALRRAYQHDWLMEFNQPHGQMIFNQEGANDISEFGIFLTFFDSDVNDLLVTETNRYAETTIANKGGFDNLSTHSRLRKWKHVDDAEMKAFLAILLLMGIDRRPNYDFYWTTEWTIQAPGICWILSRDRFDLILQLFHTTDNALLTPAGDPHHDRRGKIKQVMEMLLFRWSGGIGRRNYNSIQGQNKYEGL